MLDPELTRPKADKLLFGNIHRLDVWGAVLDYTADSTEPLIGLHLWERMRHEGNWGITQPVIYKELKKLPLLGMLEVVFESPTRVEYERRESPGWQIVSTAAQAMRTWFPDQPAPEAVVDDAANRRVIMPVPELRRHQAMGLIFGNIHRADVWLAARQYPADPDTRFRETDLLRHMEAAGNERVSQPTIHAELGKMSMFGMVERLSKDASGVYYQRVEGSPGWPIAAAAGNALDTWFPGQNFSTILAPLNE